MEIVWSNADGTTHKTTTIIIRINYDVHSIQQLDIVFIIISFSNNIYIFECPSTSYFIEQLEYDTILYKELFECTEKNIKILIIYKNMNTSKTSLENSSLLHQAETQIFI